MLSGTAIKEKIWATTNIEGIATYLCHTGVEQGGVQDIRGECAEGEEKDGEKPDGIVAYISFFFSFIHKFWSRHYLGNRILRKELNLVVCMMDNLTCQFE